MQCETDANPMLELLSRQAADHADHTAYLFLDDSEGEVELTFGQLDARARAIAAHLQTELSPGDRALLVYPPGLDFISAFFGCLYAGVVAVPATYPKPRRPMPRLQRIAVDCNASIALSTSQTLDTLDPALLEANAATNHWVATNKIPTSMADDWQRPEIKESDVAFLQYTSGSTSDPKGVVVSHGNLLNNLDCIRHSFGLGEEGEDHLASSGVFWLPAYHDMGLIGGILTPMYVGGRCVLMSPTSFLQKPLRWLQAIDKYQATISGAPNFAYEYCVRRTKAEDRATLDLSRWRLAFCGAEPIRAETLSQFADAFRPARFRANALYPCYGLAETTLLAAGPQYGKEPVISALNRAALADHRVVPAVGEPVQMVQRLVGCGQAMPGHKIVIVEPGTGTPCEEARVGEVLIQGPSVTQGYWNRPEETEEIFGACIDGYEGTFLRTGDLGFFRDGHLYVTGRVKDVIIIRGRNHYPQDIEQSVEEAHQAVLPGAVFAITVEDEERLVVVHQLDRQFRSADLSQVVQSIRRAIVEHHELDPHAIVLIRQTSLPITSSGKVQRNLCREQYLADELKVVHSWTNPAEAIAKQRSRGSRCDPAKPQRPKVAGSQRDPRKVPVGPLTEQIETWLLQWLIDRLGIEPANAERNRPFAEYGVDSLAAVELSQELEEEFQVKLTSIVAWNYPTPATLARYLAEQATGHAAEAPESENSPATTDTELEDLLAEIESLSEDQAKQLLSDENQTM